MWFTQLIKRGRVIKSGNILTRRAKSNFVDGGEHATHNDLPIPEGDFYEAWNKKNKRYNMILMSGFLSALGAAALFFGSGVVVFNYAPPCLEAEDKEVKKKEKKEEKVDEMEKEKQKLEKKK